MAALQNGSALIASSFRLAYLAIEDLITSFAPWIFLRISYALLLTTATTIIDLMYYFTFWPRYICGGGRSLGEIFRNPTRNERPPGRSQYRNWRKAKVDPWAYLDMQFYFLDLENLGMDARHGNHYKKRRRDHIRTCRELRHTLLDQRNAQLRRIYEFLQPLRNLLDDPWP